MSIGMKNMIAWPIVGVITIFAYWQGFLGPILATALLIACAGLFATAASRYFRYDRHWWNKK